MKFLLVLAAFLALSSASHLLYGKKDYSGSYNKDFVRGEGVYGKYPGQQVYGQQQGVGYQRYAPFFQGRQNVYDYYGNNYYGNKDHYYGNQDSYYGNKDYYYGNKDHYYGNKDSYYGNKDYYYGNKDYYYGNKDSYYGNRDYYYDNIDSTTPYYNPLLNQVARQGVYNQYENIIPYNYEYYNQIPSVYQHSYKGYYPSQYSYGKGYGYGYGFNYPSTYQYGRQYEPVAPRQVGY